MKKGHLSQYFNAVAAKKLKAVEIPKKFSNQHEFNGINSFKKILGEHRKDFPAEFIYFDKEGISTRETSSVTWYDSRENVSHRGPEYRLYYKTTAVSVLFKEDDLLILTQKSDGLLMIICAENGSNIESQIVWLFDLPEEIGYKPTLKEIEAGKDEQIDLVSSLVLDELGVTIEPEYDYEYLDFILKPLDGKFPSTREFSELARTTCRDAAPLSDAPDQAIMQWLDHEEMLFRRMESGIVTKRLEQGFWDGVSANVDGFIKFSLSVHNRRKSRAGQSLENHLEHIFAQFNILYSRGAVTENRSKPDFLFPSSTFYQDKTFPPSSLTMLGVKTSCKDRWRQVLSEAERISPKHLMTLEPAISEHQTREMQEKNLQLVTPSRIRKTYKESQQDWLMTLSDFLKEVEEKQKILPR